MGSAEKETFAVELEGAVLDPLGVADAEVFAGQKFRGGSGVECDAALVEVRVCGTPEMGSWHGEGGEFGRNLRGLYIACRVVQGSAFGIHNVYGDFDWLGRFGRIVEGSDNCDFCRTLWRGEIGFDVQGFE